MKIVKYVTDDILATHNDTYMLYYTFQIIYCGNNDIFQPNSQNLLSWFENPLSFFCTYLYYYMTLCVNIL